MNTTKGVATEVGILSPRLFMGGTLWTITDEAKVIFEQLDANDDGKLTRKEFISSGKLNDEDLARTVFEALDSNENGELAVPEYLRVWGRWARSGRKIQADGI